MKRRIEEVKRKLAGLKPILKERFKVESIGLFGSYVREEEKRKSDLDVLVEFSEPVGFFEFFDLEEFLSEELGVKVDLVMRRSLKSRIKERIIKETIYI